MAPLGNGVPDQDVAVQPMRVFAGLIVSIGNPVVVIGGAHFVRITVLQRPANSDNENRRILLQHRGLALLAWQVGIHIENFLGVQELQLLGQIGIAKIFQLREHGLGKFFRSDDYFPDLADNRLQELQVALLGSDDALPVPLIDVGGMVVIQEIVLAHGTHVGADALANFAIELLESDPLPLGRGLHDLRVDGMQVAIVRDMELNWRPRPVAIQHVVDTTFHIHDERDFDHHQVEFLAQVVFDIAFYLEDGLLRLFRRQQGAVTLGQNFF